MRRLRLITAAVLALIVLVLPSIASANANVAWVQQTGHTVRGSFLDFWETNGGPDIFGYPITEEMNEGGVTVQYFQRARFELVGDTVRLGLLGDDLAKGQPRMPNPRESNQGPDWEYFPETGHLVSGAFFRQFQNHGGVNIYGYPISAEVSLNGRTVQYFQRARMEWTGSSVELGMLGQEVARARNIDTSAIEQPANATEWTARRIQPSSPMLYGSPAGAPAAPQAAGKVIVVSLAQQHLWAYENGRVVLSTPVTTGAPGTPTLPGDFRIMSRHTPFLFVSPWPAGHPNWYEPSWTTYSMLYADGGYYIHDSPWRLDYGPGTTTWHQGSDGEWRQGSHGCINVPFAAMEPLFYWSQGNVRVIVE
jgi:lipoprotein-anchoring transpeptidase ErfK/SrfK